MDFPSETTRKERRNLLAAGSAGIIVTLLNTYPTEIDIFGLKFHGSNLPWVTVGALCAAITYFLIKFWISYQYERSSAEKEAQAIQIREGKPAMDISREMEALNDLSLNVIQQSNTLQNQQENEEKRIKGLQDKIYQEDIAHEAAMKVMGQKRSDLAQALTTKDPQLVGKIFPKLGRLPTPNEIEEEIKTLEKNVAPYQAQREAKRQMDLGNLENEKINRSLMHKALARKIDSDKEAADERRKAIVKWEQAHATGRLVSRPHQFLELYLPIFVGVIAIGGLIYLMLHFPPPPKPPSLPEF